MVQKLFYSMSEVAKLLDESTVTVRFWSNSFPEHINPKRNAKGNRMFTQKDVDALRKIKFLTRDTGLTLEAVKRNLSRKDDGLDPKKKLQDALLAIRTELVKMSESL